jgi:hypothetical protein
MNQTLVVIALVAIAATLPVAPAVAQAPAATAADAASGAPPEAPPKKLTRKEARALKEKADARLCLEFPTELMVVMCAEKYRLNRRDT